MHYWTKVKNNNFLIFLLSSVNLLALGIESEGELGLIKNSLG